MNRLNDAYNKDHKAADHEDSPAKRRTAFIRKKWGRITLTAFSVLIVILFAAGLLLPLRPSESQLERRSLAEFPSFSLEALWDGSYFENLVLWFSDTFPFREQLLTAEAGIESMYGLQDEAIYGNTGQTADDIPASGGMAPVISPSGSGNLSDESAPEGDSSNSGTQSESGAGSTSDSSVSSGSVTASCRRAAGRLHSRYAGDSRHGLPGRQPRVRNLLLQPWGRRRLCFHDQHSSFPCRHRHRGIYPSGSHQFRGLSG